MKVSDLIDMLKNACPSDEVLAWCPDADLYVPVTGMVYGSGNAVELQTDEG